MPNNHLRGVIAPIVTPFTKTYEVDESLYCEFAQYLLSNGCVGLVPFGTTGEAAMVSAPQRISALKALVKSGIAAEKLMLGAGMNDLWGSVALCRAACDLNCQGVLMLPPSYYTTVSDEGLFEYFSKLIALVERDNLRIYLYHIPQVSGVGLSLNLVQRLRQAFPDVIVGIKDSSGDKDNSFALMEIPDFAVYPGNELYLWESLKRGAVGSITASANLNPALIDDFISHYDKGDNDDILQQKFHAVCEFRKSLQAYPMIGGIKGVLSLSDERWGIICPPLSGCSLQEIESLKVSLGL